MTFRYRAFFFVLFAAIAGFLWLWGINLPYAGLYNTNNNYLSLAVRNYLRYGLFNLHFLPTYFTGVTFPPPNAFYLHHPILMFLSAILPFVLFGFGNWVVHVAPLLYNLGGVFMVYKISRLLYGRKVALLSLFLAAYFPMTTFFWKLIFFEQITMLFNLLILYFALKYIQNSNSKYLYAVGLFSFFAGLSDWPAFYLIIPFGLLFFTIFKRKAFPILLYYVMPLTITLAIFLFSVYVTKGNFSDLATSGANRILHQEMTHVSLLWLKYPINYLLRFAIYFTPLSILFFVTWGRGLFRNRLSGFSLSQFSLLALFILGISNTIAFPTTSWSYSYFLYYFIPFLAISGGVFLKSLKPTALISCILFIVIWSVTVNYFKISQWQKHVWKYQAMKQFAGKLVPHETIGIVNFPGDLFENYYFLQTIPMLQADLTAWVAGVRYPDVKHVVYACADACTPTELNLLQNVSVTHDLDRFETGQSGAWLISKNGNKKTAEPVYEKTILPADTSTIPLDQPIISLYRSIKQFLDIGQL